MKLFKNIKYVALAAVMMFAAACGEDDILLTPTHSLVGSTAFTTAADIENGVVGVYSGMRATAYYARNYGVLPDMMTDNLAETVQSLANYRQEVDWLYQSNATQIANAWSRPYTVINRANLVLAAAQAIQDDIDEGVYNRLTGQLLALRALCHFDLMKYYAESYDRNSTARGIIVKTESNLDYPPRNTVAESWDQIFADLEAARTALSNVDNASFAVDLQGGRSANLMDVNAVNALLARAYLYTGQYAEAVTAANAVIDNAQGRTLDLADAADFEGYWATNIDDGGEIIFALAYNNGEGRVGGDLYFSPNNRSSFAPSQAMLALYDQANDVRYDSYITENFPGQNGNFTVTKYLGRNGATDGFVDFPVLRMGEVYLIRAEANFLNGNEGAALADLNALRAARINGFVNGTEAGNALRDAIAVERRRELFAEGHRWFDLRRTNQPIIRGADCQAPSTACLLPADSPKKIWPIPQGELDANANVEQNVGYGS